MDIKFEFEDPDAAKAAMAAWDRRTPGDGGPLWPYFRVARVTPSYQGDPEAMTFHLALVEDGSA